MISSGRDDDYGKKEDLPCAGEQRAPSNSQHGQAPGGVPDSGTAEGATSVLDLLDRARTRAMGAIIPMSEAERGRS
jgi:hypothetical protein